MSRSTTAYGFAGLVIDSDVPLPLELIEGSPEPRWRVCFADQIPVRGELIRRYGTVEDGDWLVLRRSETGGVTYCFPGLATFAVESSGLIRVQPEARMHEHTLAHLLLEQVLPLEFVMEGRHVLHASAVAVGLEGSPAAVLFMGTSGAGKSTTALGCSQKGAPLLTDDFALLVGTERRHQLVTVDLGLRLWQDVAGLHGDPHRASPVAEYTTKLRVPSPSSGAPPGVLEVGALVILEPRLEGAAEPSLGSMGPAAATVEVAQNSYRVEMTDPRANQQLLDRAAALVQDVPVFRLSMPRDLENLSSHCAALLERLGSALRSAMPPASTPA